jgi:hypothetical protein
MDEFSVWSRVVELLVDGSLEEADQVAVALDQNKPACMLIRGLVSLHLDRFKARGWLLQALRDEPSLIFALSNMGGISLKDPTELLHSEVGMTADRSLVEAALLLSGIDPKRYLATPEPITSVVQAMTIKGTGYTPFGHGKDPYVLSIAYLRRPDLKGEAYRLIADSGIGLHPEFTPYLDKSESNRHSGKVTCLIDGVEKKIIAQYLLMKYGVRKEVYCSFFGLQEQDLFAAGYHMSDGIW